MSNIGVGLNGNAVGSAVGDRTTVVRVAIAVSVMGSSAVLFGAIGVSKLISTLFLLPACVSNLTVIQPLTKIKYIHANSMADLLL
jgi:hypothetical protein